MVRECAMQEATGTGRWARSAFESPPVVSRPWEPYADTLPPAVREALAAAVDVAAAHRMDVHYSLHGEHVSIEFKPSETPHVRMWEWPR
jgi:hypothetical protein